MKEKNQVVPDEVLSKEFLSQFKTEADVSKFLKQLHAQVLEKMLEGEMDAHLGYEKNSVAGNNTGNSRNGSYPKNATVLTEGVQQSSCSICGETETASVANIFLAFYLKHVTMEIRETPSKKSQEIIDYETFFRN